MLYVVKQERLIFRFDEFYIRDWTNLRHVCCCWITNSCVIVCILRARNVIFWTFVIKIWTSYFQEIYSTFFTANSNTIDRRLMYRWESIDLFATISRLILRTLYIKVHLIASKHVITTNILAITALLQASPHILINFSPSVVTASVLHSYVNVW